MTSIEIVEARIRYLKELDAMMIVQKSFNCKGRIAEAERILAILKSDDLSKEPISVK